MSLNSTGARQYSCIACKEVLLTTTEARVYALIARTDDLGVKSAYSSPVTSHEGLPLAFGAPPCLQVPHLHTHDLADRLLDMMEEMETSVAVIKQQNVVFTFQAGREDASAKTGKRKDHSKTQPSETDLPCFVDLLSANLTEKSPSHGSIPSYAKVTGSCFLVRATAVIFSVFDQLALRYHAKLVGEGYLCRPYEGRHRELLFGGPRWSCSLAAMPICVHAILQWLWLMLLCGLHP